MAACTGGADELPLSCVQEMSERGELVEVPPAFIRPPHDRPQYDHHQLLSSLDDQHIPIIDISGLLSPHTRPLVLHDISRACAQWGFFQAINHGVRDEVVGELWAACFRFFNQPAEERNKLRSQDFLKAPVAYGTSFNPSREVARDWRDVLYVRDGSELSCNGFTIAPEICRNAFTEYRREVEKLGNVLYEAILESLGLSLAYVKETMIPLSRQVIAVNYIPPCPDPSLTLGLSGHSDANTVTILLQDEVPGLQIRKGGDWFSVKPLKNAFVINVGDQIEILSNGIYKSVEHRVFTNAESSRISIGYFFGPDVNDTVAPLQKLLSEDEPPLYKQVKYNDYVKIFFNKALMPNKESLTLAKLALV